MTGSEGDDVASPGAESATARIERNWAEILQELRVVQTGTQILTGFLLTLPFQQRFGALGPWEIGVYLTLVSLAALATILALTPVALHRALFRRGAKPRMVAIANRLLRASLLVIGLTLTGTTLLVFSAVVSPASGIVAGAITLVVATTGWVLYPAVVRPRA
jgi:hypothetical protein